MNDQGYIGEKSLDELTPKERARVLASIGTRRKERPIDPVTLAEMFERTPVTNKELARRLRVTPRMVGMFQSLLSLPEEIKPYVRSGKISIDRAVRIASLKDATSQQFLAKAIVANPETFTDRIVTKIVSLKNRNQDMPIEDCTKMVLKSKPIVENHYILVTSLEKNLSEALDRKAEEQGTSSPALLKRILEQSLPSDVNLLSALSIIMHDGITLLVLTPDGWQALRQKSASLGVPLDEVLETLTRLWLEIGSSQ